MGFNPEESVDRIRQNPKLVVADDYELVTQKRQLRASHYLNGQLQSSSEDEGTWISLRVLHRKRLGRASTVFTSPDSVHLLVERAFESAECSVVDPWFRFPLWKVPKDRNRDNSILSKSDHFFQSLFPDLVVQPTSLEERYEQGGLETFIYRKSEKNSLQSKMPWEKLYYSIVNEAEKELYRVSESRGHTRALIEKESYLVQLLRQTMRLQKKARSITAPREGAYVLSGAVVVSILAAIESWFSGMEAFEEKSPLAKKLESPLFSPAINLIDDGTYAGGEASFPFDMEGVLTQETKLVERGVLKSFLHNTGSSARFNRMSTGNFVRHSPLLEPEVGASNLFIAPGERSLLDLVSSMQHGIFIETVEKRESLIDHDGNLEIRGHGWGVSQGDPVEPLCNLSLKIKPLELLKCVDECADDLKFYGRHGAPSLLIKKMPLS